MDYELSDVRRPGVLADWPRRFRNFRERVLADWVDDRRVWAKGLSIRYASIVKRRDSFGAVGCSHMEPRMSEI